jgi:hypothetical protein
MSLEKAWRWELYRGSVVALIVPAGIFAALAVLALAGGFSQLGSLGQLLSGPPVPSAALASDARAQTAPVLAPITFAAAGARIATRSTATGDPAASGRPGGHLRPGSSSRVPPPVPVASHRTPPPASAATPPTHTTPAPGSTSVDHVIGVGTGVTSKLPDPVGAIATKILQTAGQTVDKLLPSTGGTLGLLHLR